MSGRSLLAPAGTVVLLLVLLGSLGQREPSEAVERFHQEVRARAEALPKFIGSWYGREVPVPAAATKILKPNVMVSRRYRNIRTGEEVTLLLIQTRDAHDLVFHYPPVCYPYNGWNQAWEKQRHWRLGGEERPMVSYCFERSDFQSTRRVVIHNFMILPGGIYVGMDEVRRAANRPSSRFLGAGQFQLLFDAEVPEQRRREISARFIEASRPTIERIMMGKNP